MEVRNGLSGIGTASHGTEIHIFNGLPIIAALNVVYFLDLGTLQSSRGVCRQTKWLIDSTPPVMKKLRVYIQDEFRMEDIIKSDVNWSNIQIPSDLCNVKLNPFLHRFRSSITQIKIVNDKKIKYPESLNPIDLINILVELDSGFLETLCIRANLSPKRATGIRSQLQGTDKFDIDILKTLLENTNEILRSNLQRLRRLEFREITSQTPILDLLFNCIYDMCRDLVYIRLPCLSSWGREESRKEDKCPPLTSHLDRIVGSPRKYECFTIDFASIGFGSDWDHVGYYRDPLQPLTSDRLIKWLRSFERENRRVRLLNVPSTSLSGKENLSDVEKEILNRCVHSIHLIRFDDGFLRNEIYIPLNCQVKISMFLFDGMMPTVKGIQHLIPTVLNLTALYIHKFERDRCDGFFNSLLGGALCPTVVSLVISIADNTDTPLTILSKTFPNVRKLYLSACHRLDCYSVESPLNALNQLEDLTLKNCGLATNHSIHDSALPHPLFRKFKKLRRLRLL